MLYTPILHTRRVHEVKVNEVIDAKFLELENDGGQVGAEDLWVGVVLHLILVGLLCVVRGRGEGKIQSVDANKMLVQTKLQ